MFLGFTEISWQVSGRLDLLRHKLFAQFCGVLAMCLSSSAWAASDNAPSSATIGDIGSSILDRPVFTESYKDDLEGLIRRRVIRVLVAPNRTGFFAVAGELHGFDYKMMEEYRKYLKTRVRARSWPVVFVYLSVPFDQLIPMLNAGRGDIAMGGLTITPERERQVRFTKPLISGVREVIVHAKALAGIQTLEDLAGRSVYVNPASSFAQHLALLNERFEDRGLKPIEIVPADSTLMSEDILEMVSAGIVDITVADEHVATLWQDTLPNIRVREDLAVNEGGRIGWAVRKESPQLAEHLNLVIQKRAKGSLIGNILFRRYFENTKWITNPLSPEQLEKLEALAGIFKKNGEFFDIDWRVLVAIAYQESRLDHGVISGAGAVGIMQIKPETAAGPPILIPSVSEIENNVHAAAKYLAFLRDTYFKDPGMRPSDRVDFLFAAYNAGPTRINRLRKRAAKMGLNPNRWFFNVEQVARSAIGRETVNYVSSVNKYYAAYKFLQDINKLKEK